MSGSAVCLSNVYQICLTELTLRQLLSCLNSRFHHSSSGLWQSFPKSTFSFHSYPPPNILCTEATAILLKPNACFIKYNSLLHRRLLKHSPLSIGLSPGSLTCQRCSMICPSPAIPNLILHNILTYAFCFYSICSI